jgi:hypothetical protein
MTRDQLIILVALAFVLLINAVARLLRRRLGGEQPPSRQADGLEAPRPVRRPTSGVTPRQVPAALETRATPRTVPRVAPPRPMRMPLGGLRAVRHGIILMTILGPPRALVPPGPRPGGKGCVRTAGHNVGA